MFPYYELLQSNGPCSNCDENKKDLTNLNDPGLMQAYFGNFALLMKRLGPTPGMTTLPCSPSAATSHARPG